MTKRQNHRLIIGGAITTALVFVGCFILWSDISEDRVTQKNIDRISDGMSLSEISEILGKPTVRLDKPEQEIGVYNWEGKNGFATVGIFKDGTITKGFRPNQVSWLSRIKRFIGL